MVVKRVTRDLIRDIMPNDMQCFILPSVKACFTARSMVSQMGKLMNCTFKCSVNWKNLEVTVKRVKN